MQNLPDYDIIQAYGAEYRGIVGYYMLATDVWRFNELEWYAKTSMLKTLAAKHQSRVTQDGGASTRPGSRRRTDFARATRPGSSAAASQTW